MESTVKKRGRPPKVEPEIVVNQSQDAIINVSVSMPGKEEKSYQFRLKNARGNLIGSQRNPDTFIQIIEEALKTRIPVVR